MPKFETKIQWHHWAIEIYDYPNLLQIEYLRNDSFLRKIIFSDIPHTRIFFVPNLSIKGWAKFYKSFGIMQKYSELNFWGAVEVYHFCTIKAIGISLKAKKGRTHFSSSSLIFWQNAWDRQNVWYSSYVCSWGFYNALGHLGHHYNDIRTLCEWNIRWFRQFSSGRVRMCSTL